MILVQPTPILMWGEPCGSAVVSAYPPELPAPRRGPSTDWSFSDKLLKSVDLLMLTISPDRRPLVPHLQSSSPKQATPTPRRHLPP